MSRRTGRDLEQVDHHVYVLRNRRGEVLYVGRTARPDTRPYETAQRPWITTEVHDTEVSPPMPFRTACWVEAQMIRTCVPTYNVQAGQAEFPADEDPRIDRIAEAEGVDRATAKWAATYYPTNPAAFEDFLTARVEGMRQLAEEAATKGVSVDSLLLDRLDQLMDAALAKAS